ncbi:MAG: serine/threonine-protein phosphatase [Chloroflexi bacterium]|nr:serine/threonine-protein phosphatase [Chloroflexota bacterium]
MIRVESAHFPVVALTDPGRTGKNNEDRFAVTAYRTNSKDDTPVLLAVLADGIGGHRAGEVAAEMVVDLITQRAAESNGQHPLSILQQAILEASQEVYIQSQNDPSRQGMGATCACAWIYGSRLFIATVGDSRIYLMRNGDIQQLSTDHTWIQEALENGVLQPDQVRGHPNAHVIRRYLGSPTPPDVDMRLRLSERESDYQSETNQGMPLKAGDRLLLCSDGLTDLVSDEEIAAAFQQQRSFESAAQYLIDLANQRGGHDNITLIAIQVPEYLYPPRAGRRRNWLPLGCLAGVLAAAAGLALAFNMQWLSLPLPAPTPTSTATVNVQTLPVLPPTVETRQATITLDATRAPLPTYTQPPSFPAPVIDGATFTPWPTNTRVPTRTFTATATPLPTTAP